MWDQVFGLEVCSSDKTGHLNMRYMFVLYLRKLKLNVKFNLTKWPNEICPFNYQQMYRQGEPRSRHWKIFCSFVAPKAPKSKVSMFSSKVQNQAHSARLGELSALVQSDFYSHNWANRCCLHAFSKWVRSSCRRDAAADVGGAMCNMRRWNGNIPGRMLEPLR